MGSRGRGYRYVDREALYAVRSIARPWFPGWSLQVVPFGPLGRGLRSWRKGGRLRAIPAFPAPLFFPRSLSGVLLRFYTEVLAKAGIQLCCASYCECWPLVCCSSALSHPLCRLSHKITRNNCSCAVRRYSHDGHSNCTVQHTTVVV